MSPRTICKIASKRGLSAIAVTDHNTIRGSLEVMHEASAFDNLIVVPGIEIKTNMGDLIGLSCWYEAFEFLEPVMYDDQLGSRRLIFAFFNH